MNIIGRLTGDAITTTLKGDKKVVNFSVAVNESYKSKQGDWVKLTEYYDCAYWLTANVAKILTKGALVELGGWASAKAWLNKAGEPIARMSFHTSQIKLLSAQKSKQEVQSIQNENSTNKKDADDDLPF